MTEVRGSNQVPRIERALAALWEFDFTNVRERLAEDKGWPQEKAVSAETEFKRFVELAVVESRSMAAFSPLIDEFWHQAILFTNQYRTFCAAVFGGPFDHTPGTRAKPIPARAAQNFLDSYRARFGTIGDHLLDGLPPQMLTYLADEPLVTPPPIRWSGWIHVEEN